MPSAGEERAGPECERAARMDSPFVSQFATMALWACFYICVKWLPAVRVTANISIKPLVKVTPKPLY